MKRNQQYKTRRSYSHHNAFTIQQHRLFDLFYSYCVISIVRCSFSLCDITILAFFIHSELPPNGELNSEYCVRSPVAFGPYLLLSSLYSSVVERLSRKQKVCGSIPHGGILYLCNYTLSFLILLIILFIQYVQSVQLHERANMA
uniref:Uncharacterized protein n=1 Tax=Heterorhabditis bacteriophora TaxID=37862 RepID=A0A1I7WDL4_HETBA